MKCTECEEYALAQGDAEATCYQGGDTINPDEDIYCGEAGDKRKDYYP